MARRFPKKSRPERHPNIAASLPAGLPIWLQVDWLWGAALFLAVLLIYLPVWHAGFVWDDYPFVVDNPCVVEPQGLKEIWTTIKADICPLTLTTFWIEHALWGSNPGPYHLVNVFLHGGCAIVLWRVLHRLRLPGAWFGAAVWACHPVQVESVAWISETKNTQSCFFFLLTILFFVRGLQSPGKGRDILVLLFGALAMASKSSTVVLPVILCLCAWWVERRWQWRQVARVMPLTGMAIIAAGVSMRTQALGGARYPNMERGWPERLATAGNDIWFYLGKLVWPHPLIIVYPPWQIHPGDPRSYISLVLAVVVLLILWWDRDSGTRAPLFAFAYFLVALLPVLGLVNMTYFSYSWVADHLQYLADIGPLSLVGCGLARAWEGVRPGKRWFPPVLYAGLLLLLGGLSWNRTLSFENEEKLWNDTLAQDPHSSAAHSGLGFLFFQEGKLDESLRQFQKALQAAPRFAQSYGNLGFAFFQQGKVDEAINEYQKALAIDPGFAPAHYSLGVAYAKLRDFNDAIAQYQAAVVILPNYPIAYNNLGVAYIQLGRTNQAVAMFQKAVDLDPYYRSARDNLARAQALRVEGAK